MAAPWFVDASPLPGQTAFIAAAAVFAATLLACYRQQQRLSPQQTYQPRLAWLRAGIYFCACLIAASLSGVLATVLQTPLASAAQLANPQWWVLAGACAAVIAVGYGLIWPMGTFTDGRRRHALLSLLYGAVWGVCQGLWFLSLWALTERSGLAVHWVAVISYLLIGGYNGLWHRFYWDIHVSPPHNYREWNARKVLLCHTPNLLLCLGLLACYGNAGLFVLLQGLALAASAYAMRFPAWWDAYQAQAGEERSIAEAPAHQGRGL